MIEMNGNLTVNLADCPISVAAWLVPEIPLLEEVAPEKPPLG